MGLGTIPARLNGQTIDETWFNLIRTVLAGDLVPRTSGAAVLDLSASLGSTTFTYLAMYTTLMRLRSANNTNVVTYKAPDSLAGNYTRIAPPALPGSGKKILFLDSTGQETATVDVDDSTLEVLGDLFRVKASGITSNEIADDAVITSKILNDAITTQKILNDAITTLKILNDAVTTAKILNLNVTTAKLANAAVTSAKIALATILGGAGGNIASGTIDGTNIAANINLPGDTVQENGKNVAVSSVNAASSLALVRIYVDGAGAIQSGEGAAVVRNSAGNYTISYDNVFADVPSPIVSNVNFDTDSNAYNLTTTGCIVQTKQFGVNADVPFNLFVIGRR